MPSIVSLISLVLSGLIVWIVRRQRTDRNHRHEYEKHGEWATCAPIRILYGTGWLTSRIRSQMYLKAYRCGTRNQQLQELHRSHGTTFCTYQTNQVFTIDSENLKAVFGGPTDEWGVESLRLAAFQPLTGPGTLTTDGDFWRHARTMTQTNLNWIQRFRNSDLSCYDTGVRELLDAICGYGNGKTIDMAQLSNQYMIDSSSQYILGASIGSLQFGKAGQEGKEFVRAFISGLEACGVRNEAWQLTDIMVGRKFKRDCNIVHNLVDRYVQYALNEVEALVETPSQASLTLQWALKTKNAKEIRDQVLNTFAAAFDTTAITLTHTIFHLARHPECYRKLRHEALQWDGRPLSGDNIKRMTYLRAVIDEVLRLNSPATFNSRIALCNTSLPRGGGTDGRSAVYVPKGTVVSASIYTVQRNPDVYGSDANSFRPERWEGLKPKRWDYLPFSAGPRTCPGQKIALAQTAYVLLCLARRFARLENRDATWELVERYQVSTSSRNGALVAWFQ